MRGKEWESRSWDSCFCCSYPRRCLAQNKPIESTARRQIDAGNQAWIDGMKQGKVALISAVYT